MTRLETLYRQHAGCLLAYLRRSCRGGAEDVLQETFVQAMRRIDRLAQAISPRAWLFGIARNLAASTRRSTRPMAPLEGDVAEQPAPAEDARLSRMRRAITELAATHREPLELRLRDELSYEEIADVLQIPVGTVRSRLHNAVARLREMMAQCDE